MIQKRGSAIVGILVVVVIIIVAWLAYSQGYFTGKEKDVDGGSIEVKIGE